MDHSVMLATIYASSLHCGTAAGDHVGHEQRRIVSLRIRPRRNRAQFNHVKFDEKRESAHRLYQRLRCFGVTKLQILPPSLLVLLSREWHPC